MRYSKVLGKVVSREVSMPWKPLSSVNHDPKYFPGIGDRNATTAPDQFALVATIPKHIQEGLFRELQHRFAMQSSIKRPHNQAGTGKRTSSVLLNYLPLEHESLYVDSLNRHSSALPIQCLPFTPFLYPKGTGIGLTSQPPPILMNLLKRFLGDLGPQLDSEAMDTIEDEGYKFLYLLIKILRDTQDAGKHQRSLPDGYRSGMLRISHSLAGNTSSNSEGVMV